MPLSFVCPPPLPINPFSVGHITTTVETPYMHSSLPFPKAGFYYKCTVTGLESPLFGSIYNRLEILPPGGHTRPVDFKEIVGFNSSYCLSASAGLLLSVRVCVRARAAEGPFSGRACESCLDYVHVSETPPRPHGGRA